MSRIGLLGTAALLGLAGCQAAETPEQMQARVDQESAALKQHVDGIAQRWNAWIAAGQVDSIVTLYMENGREMPPNGPAAVGRAAVKAMWEQGFSMGRTTIDVRPAAVVANGPLGIERGTYTTTFTANPGMTGMPMPPPADTGKYLVHWHNVNGTWQIAELMYSSDLPLPAPPPTRRR